MDINAEISDMKVALASLEAKAKALEKPKQWEPRGGHYRVTGSGSIYSGSTPPVESKFGGVRRTLEAALKTSTAMRTHNRLLAYVDEFGGDWEADWSDNHGNYFIVYNHLPMTWEAIVSFRGCKGGAVYMSKDCAEGLVAKLNSGEVVL
tara:strand:+ start:51 stop:497 length:447 start_codon:yes stop_codon:yes gene_type:complete